MESKRTNFAFTYIGPELHASILESFDAKTCESCVDCHGFSYAFICTHVPKRASTIEHVIERWNLDSQSEKYRFYPFVGESNIVTFTKQAGQMASDHFIVKTIRDHKARTDGTSTYKTWTCRSERPYKKRRIERVVSVLSSDEDEPEVQPQQAAEHVVQATLAMPTDAIVALVRDEVITAKDALIAHLQRSLAERDAQVARLEATLDDMISATRAAFNTFLRR